MTTAVEKSQQNCQFILVHTFLGLRHRRWFTFVVLQSITERQGEVLITTSGRERGSYSRWGVKVEVTT